MTALRRPAACLAALLCLASVPVQAQPPGKADDSRLCEPAIRAAEAQSHLPKRLLGAIALVESGRPDPVSGTVRPWPWTIDAEGQPAFFVSKADAIAAVQVLQARGVASIDVGCMQVNLVHHKLAFASLDEAFDPMANARYASRFLGALYAQTRDWPSAAALYHSATPELAEPYERRVMAAWGVPMPAAVGLPESEPGAMPTGRVAVMLPPMPGQDIRVIALDATGPARR